ncbi:hypothetical protein RYH73_15725 [Olivibacter sp. CPCC 100613]|uniref:hypothetical protein n=1 Tax=Olivibacter sp. CPCC 100613 TaxID=3079931 RepID=UPI002FF97F6E
MTKKHCLYYTLFLIGTLSTFCRCQQTPQHQAQEPESLRAKQTASLTEADTSLIAILEIDSIAHLTDGVPLVFKVYNPTKDTLKFTQYHTPFEGFISNFLTVTDTAGNQIPYVGPMAKRVMPPPAETYCSVAPSAYDSISFSLVKGYKLIEPGTYTIQYNAGNISGMENGKPITVRIIE